MKNKVFQILFLIYFCSINKTEGYARFPDMSQINAAFRDFQLKNSIIMDLKIQNDLRMEYYTTLSTLNPEDFSKPKRAKKAITYYSTSTGLQEVLLDWFKQINSSSIYSLHVFLLKKIDKMSRNIKKNYEKTSDKYARLYIQNEPDSAVIIIDKVSKGLVKNAKNGILISSDQSYDFRLRLTKDFCIQNIICNPGEDKIINCSN